MANKRKPVEDWWPQAAERMAREAKTLAAVVSEMGLDITSVEAANISRSKEFQKVLWIEQNKYQQELADLPGRGKKQALGLAVFLIQKLIEEQKWEKAMDALMKLAKMEGWTEPETAVNVFAGLSQKDFDALTARVKNIADEPRISSQGTC